MWTFIIPPQNTYLKDNIIGENLVKDPIKTFVLQMVYV